MGLLSQHTFKFKEMQKSSKEIKVEQVSSNISVSKKQRILLTFKSELIRNQKR